MSRNYIPLLITYSGKADLPRDRQNLETLAKFAIRRINDFQTAPYLISDIGLGVTANFLIGALDDKNRQASLTSLLVKGEYHPNLASSLLGALNRPQIIEPLITIARAHYSQREVQQALVSSLKKQKPVPERVKELILEKGYQEDLVQPLLNLVYTDNTQAIEIIDSWLG